jgi:phosphohistidine phosphatase
MYRLDALWGFSREWIVRTLYILRHATAAAAGPEGDASRPLTPAGVREAEAIGRYMASAALSIDALVSSSAVRARETAQAVLRGMGSAREAEFLSDLYNASGPELLRWLQEREGQESKLLLVAHMPGVGELLSLLTTEAHDLVLGFAPATLAMVVGEAHWADWDYGRGSLQLLLPAALVLGR